MLAGRGAARRGQALGQVCREGFAFLASCCPRGYKAAVTRAGIGVVCCGVVLGQPHDGLMPVCWVCKGWCIPCALGSSDGSFPSSSHSRLATWLLWPLALPPLDLCISADAALVTIPLLLLIYVALGRTLFSLHKDPPLQALCLCSAGEVSGASLLASELGSRAGGCLGREKALSRSGSCCSTCSLRVPSCP